MTTRNEKQDRSAVWHIIAVAGYFALSLLPLLAVLGAYISFARATVLLGHSPVVMVNDPKHILFDDTIYQTALAVVFLSVLLVPASVPFWLWSMLAMGREIPLKLRWLAWGLYLLGWVAVGFVIKQNPGNVIGWLED